MKTKGFLRFPNFVCWGSVSKIYFSRRLLDRQPIASRGNPRTHSEVQGPFGDEVTYPKCRKSRQFKISLFSATRSGARASHKVPHHFSAHFRLVKPPSIAIWGKKLNRGGPYEFELDFEFPDPADRLDNLCKFVGPVLAQSGLTK